MTGVQTCALPISEDERTGDVDYNFERRRFGAPEAPGASVFYRDEDGVVYHTYSCCARGLDAMNGAYQWLDLTPKGRDEDGLPVDDGVGASSRQVRCSVGLRTCRLEAGVT